MSSLKGMRLASRLAVGAVMLAGCIVQRQTGDSSCAITQDVGLASDADADADVDDPGFDGLPSEVAEGDQQSGDVGDLGLQSDGQPQDVDATPLPTDGCGPGVYVREVATGLYWGTRLSGDKYEVMVKDCRWGYRWSSLVKTGQPSGWQQLTHMANIPLFFATSSCKELIGIGITFGSFPPDWLFFATQTQQWVYIGDQEVNMDFHSFRPPFADDLACQAQPDGLTLALPIWPAPWLPPLPAGSLELVERSDAPPEDAWRLPGPP